MTAKRATYAALFSGFCAAQLVAQNISITENSRLYHILDRIEIKCGSAAPIHSALKPYTRVDAVVCAIHHEADSTLTEKDKADIQYVFDDNNEWLAAQEYSTLLGKAVRKGGLPVQSESSERYARSRKPIFGIFYKTPANLFEINKKDFYFKLNPILDLQYAKAKDQSEPVFFNRRGLELRGGLDDRIYFYTNVLETQARFPDYVNTRVKNTRAVPGTGTFKDYSSDIFNIKKGYDFLNAQGYVGFNITPHVGLQVGQGRHFFGNGHRSMLLSNFSNNYFYFKINWRVGNFHYQNLFAEIAADVVRGSDLVPKKYLATHHLSYNFSPNLNFGLFEAVAFSRNNQFEFQYLNPVILYRTVEQLIGSPDNVLLGLDGKWNFRRQFQLYGQVIFDEFQFKELFIERNGWWGNKYGWQLGLKYIDALGIDHLDLQVEWNGARPFTYTHRDSSANYAHFNQPLAHPLGANFKEVLFLARYRLLKKAFVDARLFSMTFGEDTPTENWGSNVLTSHLTRVQNYGNKIGQGVKSNVLLASLDISYELFHNCFIDLRSFWRKQDSDDAKLDGTTLFFGAGLRLNSDILRMEF